VIGHIRRLRRLAEDQLKAAIDLDVAAVHKLSERRADTLFELQLILQRAPLVPEMDMRLQLQAEIIAISNLDRRMRDVSRIVLGALDPVTTTATGTYGRRGRVGG